MFSPGTRLRKLYYMKTELIRLVTTVKTDDILILIYSAVLIVTLHFYRYSLF